MRTKEEVIECLDWKSMDEQYAYTYSQLEEAMDQYAKEMCLDYLHWFTNRIGFTKGERPEEESEQLFDIYLKQKQ